MLLIRGVVRWMKSELFPALYEFTTDRLFGLLSQNGSLVDTMADIICGTVGAAGTALYLAYRAKRHPLSILAAKESHL